MEILITYNIICMKETCVQPLMDGVDDYTVPKQLLENILLTFVQNENIPIIKLLTGRLTAHQHIKATNSSE